MKNRILVTLRVLFNVEANIYMRNAKLRSADRRGRLAYLDILEKWAKFNLMDEAIRIE